MKLEPCTDIIFVAGYPRSGTTWFSNLINSHEKVIYRHELIGRNYEAFGTELFDKIKYANGLSNIDYKKAIRVLCSADINTDKPPFFAKKIGLSKSPKIHHICWLMAKFCPPTRPIYDYLFRIPENLNDYKILLKETRSTTNMRSILQGLRVKNIIFLVRTPHGSIASRLSGIKKGKMPSVTPQTKLNWFKEHKNNAYIQSLEYTTRHIEKLSDAEFFAIDWRVYHLGMLELKKSFTHANLCFYEEFVNNTEDQTKILFEKLKLEYNNCVKSFIYDSSGEELKENNIKDSSSDFYSVYRGPSFNIDAWKIELSDIQKANIDKHVTDIYDELKMID